MPPAARVVFYLATLGAVAFAARAVLHGPPDLWISIACSGIYAAIVLAGVFVLRLQMFADVVLRGPEEARGIVLTFDDGPDPVHTRAILDLLDAHDHAKATFFLIGCKVDKHPEVAAEIVKRGHEVGVHGHAHDRLFSLRGPRRVQKDLERAIKSIEKATNTKPTLFRPPIGHTNPTIARIADRLDLTMIGWSIAGYDGVAAAKAKRVASRVSRALDDREIILLHDAAERDDHTPAAVEALPLILAAAKDKNLAIVPLRTWVDALDAE